jgi:hypothetical protein
LKPLRRRRADTQLLLGIPRISPEREFAAIRALLKPQLRTALEHQIENGEQRWPRDGGRRIAAISELAREHFGTDIAFHSTADGEFHALASVNAQDRPAILATAVLLSRMFPGLWITVGRIFARDGRFFRRRRGVKLIIRPATNVHLTREHRKLLQEILKGRTQS